MTNLALVKCLAILKLPEGANFKDVQAAYKRLVKELHPDQYADKPRLMQLAEEELKIVNAAFKDLQEHFRETSRNAHGGASAAHHQSAPNNGDPESRSTHSPRQSPSSKAEQGTGFGASSYEDATGTKSRPESARQEPLKRPPPSRFRVSAKYRYFSLLMFGLFVAMLISNWQEDHRYNKLMSRLSILNDSTSETKQTKLVAPRRSAEAETPETIAKEELADTLHHCCPKQGKDVLRFAERKGFERREMEFSD